VIRLVATEESSKGQLILELIVNVHRPDRTLSIGNSLASTQARFLGFGQKVPGLEICGEGSTCDITSNLEPKNL
jgi:hypothetical protein